MLKTLVRFLRDDEGAGMFEYAILLGVGVAVYVLAITRGH